MSGPRFYFTLHPGDMIRTRILPGADVMLVASAFWDDTRSRFKVRRPPADTIGRLVIDSGGFTAAKRWGRYPWTCEQYVEWIREESRAVQLGFAACMDYACERDVNRTALATNRERIRTTIENEVRLRRLAPDIPWLGVLQGNTTSERLFDIRVRRALNLLGPQMGVGSICGRSATEAADVLRLYRRCLGPKTTYHAFGLDCRTLDYGDDIWFLLASWDSYPWCWPRGKKSERPSFLRRIEGETRSTFTKRLATAYLASAIEPRLSRPRQRPLLEATA